MTGTEFAFSPARETGSETVSGVDTSRAPVGSGGPIGRWTGSDADTHGHAPGGTWTRLLEIRVMARAAAIGFAALLAVTGCTTTHSPSPRSNHTSAPLKVKPASCTSSGCAVTRSSVSLPQSTVLYGASCSGVHGSWFFNAIEGGGSNQLRPNYRLQWSFADGVISARPMGLSASLVRIRPESPSS